MRERALGLQADRHGSRLESLTPGVTIGGGSFPLNPATIPVSGAPGSTATIEVCAFNAAAAASGKPYDCCRTKVTVTIPRSTCGGIK